MKEKYQKLANEYVVSLFPAFMLPIGMVQGTKKFFNSPVKICFKIEDNAVEWYFLPENWKQAHLRFVEKLKKNPDFLYFAYDQMVSLANRQIKFGKSIKAKLKSSSNNQLVKYYQKFIKYNIELYQYGLLLPLLDYNDLTFLSDELHKILKQKNADKYFNLLTIPYQETVVKKQELDLLIILQSVLKQNGLKTVLKNGDPCRIIEVLKNKYPRFWQTIRKHTQKYTWAYYVYEGPAVDEKYFLQILQDWSQRKLDPKKEIASYLKYSLEVKNKQRALIKNLDLNKYEKQILDLTRDGVFIKPYRRELQSCSYYFIEPLLIEIGKRLSLSLKQVRTMLPDEVKNALLKHTNFSDLINERQKLLVYRYVKGKMICLTGKKAESFAKKNFVIEKINFNLNIFQGATAFGGKIKGRVKIINSPKEMGKCKKGIF